MLYLDDRMVVVDKPSGLLVHRSPIDRHETRFALQIVRDQLGRRVHPVHRLDKGTSGALVLALDPEAAALLSQAFATRSVSKTYVALVRGWPDASGTIDRALAAFAKVGRSLGVLPAAAPSGRKPARRTRVGGPGSR